MVLRELKKEAHSIPNISHNYKKFKENWLRHNSKNSHLPFLKDLNQETKRELNQKLVASKDLLKKIEAKQFLNEKLQQHARYLIEMKLTTFNGDQSKSDILTNQMLNDDFLNIKQTIIDVQEFDQEVRELHQQYHEINDLLQKKLSLEEMLFYLDLPHKMYLYNLLRIADRQKLVVRDLGRHFVKLARENRKIRR